MAEANLLGALTRSGEKYFRCGRVRVFFEEVMFDFPHVVDADFVGQLDLIERVLNQLQFCAGPPRPR